MLLAIAICAAGLLEGAAPPVRAQVNVQVAAGRVDIAATSAPLWQVLDHLAQRTGMKVIYQGARPLDLVTASLSGRSHVEAVNDLLKDRRLNYALAVDASGRVETLIVVSAEGLRAPASSQAAPAPPSAAVVGSLIEFLEAGGSLVGESLRAETPAGATEPVVKAEEVLPPELLERLSLPAASPVAIPEGSLLQLLLLPGSRPSPESPAPAPPAPPLR